MRLASYNVHGCVGSDGRFSPSRILGVIQEMAVDAVGLQEVDSRAGAHADAFRALRDGTGFHAVAGPNIVAERGQYGNLLLTRWPPVAVRRLDLSVAPYEPRGALDVEVDAPGGRIRVVVAHLGLRLRERRRQLAALRAALARHRAPGTAVLADFNVARWRGPDLFGRPGAGPLPAPRTYPARWPLLALDRIQVSPREVVHELVVHRSPLAARASDHLPVVARLESGDGIPVPRGE